MQTKQAQFFIFNGGTIECGLETPQIKPKMSKKQYQGQADVSKVILFVRWQPVSALQANPMSQSYKRSPEAVRAETVQKWSRESQRVPEVRAEDVTLVRAEAVKMWSQQWRAAWSKLRCLRSNLVRSMIFMYICGSPTHVFSSHGWSLKGGPKTHVYWVLRDYKRRMHRMK